MENFFLGFISGVISISAGGLMFSVVDYIVSKRL